MKKRNIKENNMQQIKNKKQTTETTTKDYVKLAFIFLGIIFVFIFFISRNMKSKEQEIEYIKKDFTEIRGIIIEKSLYKGKSITIKYLVNGIYYIESDGFSKKLEKKEGDSISIKYSNQNPELMISECNWDY